MISSVSGQRGQYGKREEYGQEEVVVGSAGEGKARWARPRASYESLLLHRVG